MKLNSKVIAMGIAAAFAASATPAIGNAQEYRHNVSTSAQVEVRSNDVAPVLAVLVGGLVLASAIHASSHSEPVYVAAPYCPPRYSDCDDRGGWQDDQGWHGDRGFRDHGRGHGRWHERGWERHGH
jgi:hypothetical protein